MKVLVVGPGAMGTLFAGLLVEGGHEVSLLGRRPEVIKSISENGIVIERDGAARAVPVRAVLRAQDAGRCDLVLMFVKAYSTLQASRDAAAAAGEDTVVLTLQNGLGNVDAIASVFGRRRVLAGVTAHGATLIRPGNTRHAGVGETSIGELDGALTPRLSRLAEAFRSSGVEVEASNCVECLIWGKLIVNAGINPLTAILHVPNGGLLERSETRDVMAAAASEATAVAAARGMPLPYEDALVRIEEVCRLTAANRSSMLQDVERGVQTEVDYINGAIVREGVALGVPTPVNWTLTQLIKAIEPPREVSF